MAMMEERRISPRAFLGSYALSVLADVAVAAVLFASGFGVLLPVAALPTVAVFVYAKLARAGSSYRLYPDRLELESGIISRKIENVELFRVRDVGLRQSLLGRLANYGDVYIHSTDSSTPDVHVRSIDAPKEFYQEVRELVSASRAQNRTMIVEGGQSFAE